MTGIASPGASPSGGEGARPDVARMYDYYLGGTANYAIDRQAAERVLDIEPMIRSAAWANRGFLQRASGWIARQGVDQFLDLGAGLPTMNNTHDVVHTVNPDARVVYVDSNPEAVAHGRRLIDDAGAGEGVSYIRGDIRLPEEVLSSSIVAEQIDLARPVGLLLIGVLYFVADPYPPVNTFVERLCSGSYLAVSHLTSDHQAESIVSAEQSVYTETNENIYFRGRSEIEAFFTGSVPPLEFVPPYEGARPGLSYVGQWGAEDPVAADDDAQRRLYAGVARKP
jgi:hypothetical protein